LPFPTLGLILHVYRREVALEQHVKDQGAALDSLLQIAQNAPRPARVMKTAWLREAPNTTAAKVGAVLAPGTELIVYERSGGWLRVVGAPSECVPLHVPKRRTPRGGARRTFSQKVTVRLAIRCTPAWPSPTLAQ
jgi:hypothetical protein